MEELNEQYNECGALLNDRDNMASSLEELRQEAEQVSKVTQQLIQQHNENQVATPESTVDRSGLEQANESFILQTRARSDHIDKMRDLNRDI